MIWAITIAILLATVLTVLLMFSVLSEGEESAPREQRKERRTSVEFDVELYGLDEAHIYEMAHTENVSRHGARVVTKTPWHPNDRVVVTLRRGDQRSRAKIAYCVALPGDVFAIGLKLSSAFDSWLMSASGMSNFRDSHPFRK